jgi:hypothetical protein
MNSLFGIVDNLTMFVHPKFNESFKFMDNKQSIELAKKVLDKFTKSGYENIVVIESGTSPLIEIIKKLKEYKNCSFTITQMKIPRDLNFDLLKWFNTYLTDQEMSEKIKFNNKTITRYDALKEICKTFSLEDFVGNDKFTIYDSVNNSKKYDNSTDKFIDTLKGTKMYELFNKPFLLFDEYINAGTIIRNFNGIVRLFTNKPKFKLSAFCMFLDNPSDYENIEFTLYDNSNELECYRNGAYPFENRIDLIGYYYFISENDFMKVYLKDLKDELKVFTSKQELEDFYNKLNKLIDTNELLSKLKNSLAEEQVKNYVSNNDIIRFIFKYLDEKLYGKNKYSDYLDQVFELYAPSWSPMPVIYHLDYWNGFEKILKEIDKLCLKIEDDYKKYRFTVIKESLNSLLNNYKLWKEDIDKKLEGC